MITETPTRIDKTSTNTAFNKGPHARIPLDLTVLAKPPCELPLFALRTTCGLPLFRTDEIN